MRVALYERVSTEEQSLHGLSIEAQKAALEQWAEGKTIVGHYTDLGISARKPIAKRPELQRLLRDCEAGKIDLICFTRLDRWTRNIREYYKAQDILDAHGVAWRALQEDYETETAAGRLKVNIMLAVAQDEADRTSERIKAVFARKKEKGLVPSGTAPFGVVNVGGVLQPSEDAQRVRDLFEVFINSRSTNEVMRQSERVLGKPMTGTGVRYLLRNKTYVQAGVVDKATFDKVQEILAVRATRNERSGREYIFAGLMICPVCGRSMTSHRWTYKEKDYIYYRCYSHQMNKQCPYNKSIREDKVEEFLLKRLGVLIEDYNVEVKQKQQARPNPAAIKSRMDKLTDLYLSDTITKEDYLARYEPLKNALKDTENAPKPVPAEVVNDFTASYESFSRKARKAFWSRLLVRIVPTEDGFFPVFDRNDNKQLLFSMIVKMGI